MGKEEVVHVDTTTTVYVNFQYGELIQKETHRDKYKTGDPYSSQEIFCGLTKD